MSTRAPARPAGAAPLPGTLGLGLGRVTVELRAFFRERDAVVFIFAYPLLMMAIFGTVFSDTIEVPGGVSIPFAQYFLPGMIATGLTLTSFQTLATTIAVERDEGGLKRLRGTPLPPVAYFIGKIGLVLITTVVQIAALLVLAATAYDVPMPDDAGHWLTFSWVFLLGTAAGAVCGIAFSSVPRSGRSVSAVVVPVVLVLQFTSGVFFPFYQLPAWMQTAASIFPLRWVAEGMRSVFLPDAAKELEITGTWQHPMTAAVLAAWLILGLVIGIRTFRWRRRDDG